MNTDVEFDYNDLINVSNIENVDDYKRFLERLDLAVGKIDIHELLLFWTQFIFNVSTSENEELKLYTTPLTNKLISRIKTKKLKLSLSTQCEALTKIVEHLIEVEAQRKAIDVLLNHLEGVNNEFLLPADDAPEGLLHLNAFEDKLTVLNEAVNNITNTAKPKGVFVIERERIQKRSDREGCKRQETYFATFRNLKANHKYSYNMYGGSWEEDVNYGKAIVSIPKFRNTPLPTDSQNERTKKLAENIDRSRYFVVESEIEVFQSENLFLEDLKSTVQNKTLLVFIHGFRQSHTTALMHCAQIHNDLGLGDNGAPLLLSWPSATYGYFKTIDCYRNYNLPSKFANIINNSLEATEAKKVLLIGHSMGCRIIAEALDEINIESNTLQYLVFGSPDISVDDFNKLVSPRKLSKQNILVYASKKDKALKLSSLIDEKRAGRYAKDIAQDGLDVVSTELCYSNFWDFTRHSDFSYGALEDLHSAFVAGLRANERSYLVKKFNSNNQSYWAFG